MKHKIFTVYDSKSECYMQPFFAPTRPAAMRMFEDTVNSSESRFHAHAADYTLFEIGEYDDAIASLRQEDANVSLGCAVEYLKKK